MGTRGGGESTWHSSDMEVTKEQVLHTGSWPGIFVGGGGGREQQSCARRRRGTTGAMVPAGGLCGGAGAGFGSLLNRATTRHNVRAAVEVVV